MTERLIELEIEITDSITEKIKKEYESNLRSA